MANNLAALLAKHEELVKALIHEDDADIRADINIKITVLEEAINEAAA